MSIRSIIGPAGWRLGCALVGILVSASSAQLQIEDIPADQLPPGATEGTRLVHRNLRVAAILNRLDIDGDGLPDNSPDTDGDGLPDNWEVGGFESLTAGGDEIDRVVFFPAPSPIVPGTPPTPIFSRLAIATRALNPDSDGDGVSDFVEVFGLLFIDEDLDGLLEEDEWNDINGDGLPSPGEWPLDNSDANLLHDFDGFIFTDPTNDDTDGDGINDADDNDPLINPRAFGNAELTIVRFNLEGDQDADNDGLGNGMDLGNDLVEGDGDVVVEDFQVLDNPENVRALIELFRPDLLLTEPALMPESQIEDLLGADWDANGLWRTTDIREWSLIIDPDDPETLPPAEFFVIDDGSPDGHALYATQTFDDLAQLWNEDPDYDRYGGRGVGMGWHSLLQPSGRTSFIPDPHVWAVLYSWRMPGFDIDGDGFVGAPNVSSTAAGSADPSLAVVAIRDGVLVNTVPINSTAARDLPLDDNIPIAESDQDAADEQPQLVDQEPILNGRIKAPDGFPTVPCGTTGTLPLFGLLFGLFGLKLNR